jgi:hypothetical protein
MDKPSLWRFRFVKHPRVWRFVAALIHAATISITSWAISRTSDLEFSIDRNDSAACAPDSLGDFGNPHICHCKQLFDLDDFLRGERFSFDLPRCLCVFVPLWLSTTLNRNRVILCGDIGYTLMRT